VIEYDCVDCRVHVYEFGRAAPSEPPRCATCLWVSEIEDPIERERVRKEVGRCGLTPPPNFATTRANAAAAQPVDPVDFLDPPPSLKDCDDGVAGRPRRAATHR
jgi:hypothetical protein